MGSFRDPLLSHSQNPVSTEFPKRVEARTWSWLELYDLQLLSY